MGASNLGCVTLQFIYIHFPVLCEPSLSATALSQATSRCVFQPLAQMAHVCLHSRKRVHTRLSEKNRTQRLTRRNRGRFGWGRYYYPRSVPHVHKHPRPGCQNGKLCRFWVLVGCAPEERREPSGQRCAYARRCSEASRPRWAAQLYLFIGVFTFVKDLAGCCQYSSPITKGAADSNIRIGTLSGHDQNTPRRSKIQKLNAMRQHIRVLQCMALRLSG